MPSLSCLLVSLCYYILFRMKVIIFSDSNNEAESLVKKFGFEIVQVEPDFVVSYGGDGTLMRAEHKFPGVPKIILRGSRICKKCPPFSNEEILDRIKSGSYVIEEFYKLEVSACGQNLVALNDIIVHNKDPRHALRYRLWINNKEIGREIVGDGVVVATPFGSEAYYRSITDSFFEVGIGIAFNNSTEQSDHMVVQEDSEIKIRIVRGPALVYADNQEKFIELQEKEEAIIKKSSQAARIVAIKN